MDHKKQELANLIKKQYPGFVNSQTDVLKIKKAELIGNNIIFTEMENGSTRIYKLEKDRLVIYGSGEVLRQDVYDAFKLVFRDARISSIMEEEI